MTGRRESCSGQASPDSPGLSSFPFCHGIRPPGLSARRYSPLRKEAGPSGLPLIWCSLFADSSVYRISQLCASLELGNLLGCNLYLLLCCGVDALMSRTLIDCECTEAYKLYFVTCYECAFDGLCSCVQCFFASALLKPAPAAIFSINSVLFIILIYLLIIYE